MMDVALATHRTPEPPGEALQPAIARPVVAPERPLQLDPEAVGAEGTRQPAPQRLGRTRLARQRAATGTLERRRERPVARAPREADESLRTSLERGERQHGGEGIPIRTGARVAMSLGDQPAQIPPPGRVLDQKREMKRPGCLCSPSTRPRRSGARRTPCTPARTPSLPRRRRGRSGRGPDSPAPPPFAPAPPAPTPRRGRSRRSGSAARRSSCSLRQEPAYHASEPARGRPPRCGRRPAPARSSGGEAASASTSGPRPATPPAPRPPPPTRRRSAPRPAPPPPPPARASRCAAARSRGVVGYLS